MDFKGDCFSFQQDLMPGDYTIPFEFTLPPGVPASIMYHNQHHYDSPKAFVKYSVKATIVTHSRQTLKYKQMLVIHEPPVQFVQNAQNKQ